MATLYDVKPRFQAFIRPLVGLLARHGATANGVTVAALVMSVLYGAGLWFWPNANSLLLGLPVILVVRMALNAMDGMLAREHNQATRLGALLNEAGDLVSDAALYLPLAVSLPAPAALVVVVVALGLISEAAGISSVMIGNVRRYDGPLGKSDRAAAFGLLAFVEGLSVTSNATWMPIAVAALAVLAILTIGNRVRRALEPVQ